MSPGNVGQVVAKNIQQLRQSAGWNQEMLARAMREEGGHRWYRSTVAKIETFTRIVTISELVTLAKILRCTPGSLLESSATKLSTDRGATKAVHYRAAVFKDFLEIEAAEALGISLARLKKLCTKLWGNSFFDEREKRLREKQTSSADRLTVHALRGHATRQLMRELRSALDGVITPVARQQCGGGSEPRAAQ